MEKKLSKIMIGVLFILSGLSFIYFLYMLSVSGSYVSTMVEAGEASMSKNFGQIVQYFMKNTSSYLFYSVCLMFMGMVMRYILNSQKEIQVIEEKA